MNCSIAVLSPQSFRKGDAGVIGGASIDGGRYAEIE